MKQVNVFGSYIRKKRLDLYEKDKEFSLNKVATRLEVQPAYLSCIERGIGSPPSQERIRQLAEILSEDPDILLAMVGKISSDLVSIITKRPALFADLIRTLKNSPDKAVFRLVREVRDGNW